MQWNSPAEVCLNMCVAVFAAYAGSSENFDDELFPELLVYGVTDLKYSARICLSPAAQILEYSFFAIFFV
ncbi:unnamed protein product [Gongylonema pulchrum]|uniref:Fatty acyl-CoA reductase n=1 Tax=Gongylonema pulchrum TaxID=637853 RepID=A0A183EIS8_9BILA|nr:unnamed protein product [Gongylonema pulchrum]